MKKIPLTQGKYALVDNEDFDWLNQWKWCFSHGYAITRSRGKKEYMHRIIMNTPNKKFTDHINGNGLDNRKSNLRICTSSDNQHNRSINKNNTTGYKNIIKERSHWRVRIMYNYKNYFSELFDDINEAINWRDIKIKELHGSFAKTESW